MRALRIRLRVFAHHRRVHGGQISTRRFERRTGREAAEQLRHPVGAVGDHRRAEVMRAGHDVRDDLRVGWIGNGWLEDADDRRGARAEADGLADDQRIAIERRRPEMLRENRHARGLWTVVLRVQQTPERRPQSHHVEERAVDDARSHRARLAAQPRHREFDRGEVAERADGGDARLEIVDFRDRERGVLRAEAWRALADVDQPIFVAIDERPEKHAADDAEDRRVGADAERECEDDGGGEALDPEKRADGEANVAAQRFCRVEPPVTPDGSHRVACERDVAELLQRRPSSRLRILAALDVAP